MSSEQCASYAGDLFVEVEEMKQMVEDEKDTAFVATSTAYCVSFLTIFCC